MSVIEPSDAVKCRYG